MLNKSNLGVKEEDISNALIPIARKYCKSYTDFVTYIAFDIELHLLETYGIRSNVRINESINDGKSIGTGLRELGPMTGIPLNPCESLDITSSA